MLASCESSSRHLIVENATQKDNVTVLFTSDSYLRNSSSDTVYWNGKLLNRTVLSPGEEMRIGTVNRSYVPEAEDLNLDYMEFRYKRDTIIFNGKSAIFSSFQKKESQIWRYIIK